MEKRTDDWEIAPNYCIWVPKDKKWFCYPPKEKRTDTEDLAVREIGPSKRTDTEDLAAREIGPVTCIWVPKDKKWFCYPPKSERTALVDKRDGAWNCWEAADGQIHCIPKSSNLEKRQGDWNCWETATGQIDCTVAKREDGLEKRQGDWNCWETATGQIDCTVANTKREAVVDNSDTEATCWAVKRDQVWCAKEKRVGSKSTFFHTLFAVFTRRLSFSVLALPPLLAIYCQLHLSNTYFHIGPRTLPGIALPVLPGTSEHCGSWYNITTADPQACMEALAAGNINLAEFRSLNLMVNQECSNLMAGYAYCIGRKSPILFLDFQS